MCLCSVPVSLPPWPWRGTQLEHSGLRKPSVHGDALGSGKCLLVAFGSESLSSNTGYLYTEPIRKRQPTDKDSVASSCQLAHIILFMLWSPRGSFASHWVKSVGVCDVVCEAAPVASGVDLCESCSVLELTPLMYKRENCSTIVMMMMMILISLALSQSRVYMLVTSVT